MSRYLQGWHHHHDGSASRLADDTYDRETLSVEGEELWLNNEKSNTISRIPLSVLAAVLGTVGIKVIKEY